MESEDEDRKFFRAAAEAIVATSMNNPIDPTILELLRRIQYASLSKNQPTQNQNTENLLHQQLAQQQQGLIDSTKAANFPTFNLNYFGLGNGGSNGSSSSQNSVNHNNKNGTSSTNTHVNHQRDSWTQQTSNTRNALNSDSINDPGPKHTPLPNDQNSHSGQTPVSNNTPTNPFVSSNTESAGSPDDDGPKPYACRDCTLSFRRSSDLRRHQRAHLPILPHVCQRCGKGFARKDALKRHVDTLTCKRNRERMLSGGGDLEGILARANEIKRQRLNDMDEDEEDDYNGKDEEDDY